MYDVIIIGSGPAGFTAGIYAARREMKTLIIGKEAGGQLIWASEIENYPGFKNINNYDLITKMQEQVKNLGVELKTAEIQKISKVDDVFELSTSKDVFKAKTVIVAMGLAPRRLAIPGEDEFTGKGVSYCANCDGPFYKEKIVAVVGGGNSALDAAEVLGKIAKKVYLVHRRQEFKGFEALVEEVKAKENIELILDSEVKEIVGKDKLEKIIVANVNSKEDASVGSAQGSEIEIDGLFIEVGRIAHTDIIDSLADRDKAAQIIVDEKQMTKTPGIFAAGDVCSGEFKQITIATGEATIAALAAYQYLQMKSGEKVKPVLDKSTD
jgi:thioredoxin-disulfide reductase